MEWFDKFTQFVNKHGYTRGETDHTLFMKFSPKGKLIVLIVYMDTIILTREDLLETKRFKKLHIPRRALSSHNESALLIS